MKINDLLQNVEDLKVQLNEVSVYDLDVHTSLELYYSIAKKFNTVIKELSRFEGIVSDEVIKQNEKLVYLLGEGLNSEVVSKINNMVYDGTMDKILNNKLFNKLNSQIIDKASKEYVNAKFESIGNSRTFKGSCNYSDLPISGNIDDYWYVLDKENNYCWNGSSWVNIGNNLKIDFNSINLNNLDIDLREDIGDYKIVTGVITDNQAYYPNSNIATVFNSPLWKNTIIDNIKAGTVFKVTLSYANSDNMYGIIFTDDNFNVISTDLKGKDYEQKVKNYRITTPKGATKLIVNCFKSEGYQFVVTELEHNKLATKKYLEENLVSNDDLEKIYHFGENKIDSSQYENRSYIDVFPSSNSCIEIPISENLELGNGVDYKFKIWFTDGTNIKNAGKVSYLDENNIEITWYAYGNPVNSNFPITGARTIRVYALSEQYNELSTKKIKGFTFSKLNLSDYVKHEVKISYRKIEELINESLGSEHLNVMRSINRIGYDVYNANTPPEQSIESFKLAYKKGFRILLCDLRFTSDNIPVCIHDESINSVARNKDGTVLSSTIDVSDNTLSTLNNYDYGLKKGSQYKGTKILTLDAMCNLVKNLGVELYIEIKQKPFTSEQLKIAYKIVKKYGLKNVTWVHDTPNYLVDFPKVAPNERIGIMPKTLSTNILNSFLQLKTDKNSLMWFAWDTSELNENVVNSLIENNIEFEMGTLDNEESIINYVNKSEWYKYCTGISSNKLIAGKVILENEIK